MKKEWGLLLKNKFFLCKSYIFLTFFKLILQYLRILYLHISFLYIFCWSTTREEELALQSHKHNKKAFGLSPNYSQPTTQFLGKWARLKFVLEVRPVLKEPQWTADTYWSSPTGHLLFLQKTWNFSLFCNGEAINL